MGTGSGLHTRKKQPAIDDGSPPPGSAAADDDSGRKDKGRRCLFPRFLRSDVGRAVGAVIGFLVLGVMLGYFILRHRHRKVVLQASSRHSYHPPRLVTLVLPSVVNPKKRTRRLDSILETWGPAARAVYVVHDASEFPQVSSSRAIISEKSKPNEHHNNNYPQLLLIPPHISFDDGIPRLRYVIETVFEKINPDFAFFVNDHTFVLPEHLCKYLEDMDPNKDMYHGHALRSGEELIFNSGAAGYVLSRVTMKKLIQKWKEDDPTCTAKNARKFLQGNPGIVTTECLKKVLNIEAVDTRARGMFHRFHAFPITRVVSGNVDGWYIRKHSIGTLLKGVNSESSSYDTLLDGPDCCASDTVSFHYVEYKESLALFATREALLKNPQMSDQELKLLMGAEWPRGKDVGAYSRDLPNVDDAQGWGRLLQTVRKISTRQTQREC